MPPYCCVSKIAHTDQIELSRKKFEHIFAQEKAVASNCQHQSSRMNELE